MKFLCHTHDGWTDANHNGVIGTSLKIINDDMVCIPIATGLIHYNGPHKSEVVAAELDRFYMERYGIELSKICLYSASDTANGARKVSFFIDALQEDCEMHIGQLVIQYAIGHKENRGMVEEVDEDGKVVKKRGITTLGGPFPEGLALIKKCEAIVNYFNLSSQRKAELNKITAKLGMELNTLKNPAVTRVGSHIMMFQSLISNYHAIRFYFETVCNVKNPFYPLWTCMTPLDWQVNGLLCFYFCFFISF